MANNHTHEQHADDGEVHAHLSSLAFYVGIFCTLIVLTLLTVKVSYYDFGKANIVIALVVATLKASLVAAFFMHLRHDKLFNTVAFLSAFLFLAIFILLTYDDVGVRGRSPHNSYTFFVDPHTGEPAPGGEPATSATSNSVAGEEPPHSGIPGEKKKE